MMNRIYKTNIIKRSLLAIMAAVTLLTSAVLPSQAVYASTNVVANFGNSIKDLKEAAGVALGNSIYQGFESVFWGCYFSCVYEQR